MKKYSTMKIHVSLILCLSFVSSVKAAPPENQMKRAVDPVPVTSLVRDNEEGKAYQIRDALCLGKFEASSVDEALKKPFIEETSSAATEGKEEGGRAWTLFRSEHERILVRRLSFDQDFSDFAVYFSYWLYLDGGAVSEDKFTTVIYVASKAKVFVNGQQKDPDEVDGVSERLRYQFKDLNLPDGWNHFLIKISGMAPDPQKSLQGASVAIRIRASTPEFMRRLTFATAVGE